MTQSAERDEKLHVLVVEDNDIISAMLSDALPDYGFEVHSADNASDALRILLGNQVDVLFTDIQLIDSDGAELAVLARQLRPDLPVVYASAFALEAARAVPRSAFVAKPYDVAKVCSLLAHAAQRPEGYSSIPPPARNCSSQ